MTSKGESSRQAISAGKGIKSKVQISKTLTYFLRHGAADAGITLDERGWTSLPLLLQLPQFKSVSVDTVKEIVSNCRKQRLSLTEREGQLYIRANQGHSVQNINPDLEEVTLDKLPEVIVHGTYKKHWDSIKASGLHRCSRTHIHLAPGLPGQANVMSGARSSCQLHIYIDASKAIADGVTFFRSQNNVILCPGNAAGYLEPKYFSKVIDVCTGDLQIVPVSWRNVQQRKQTTSMLH